jgi:nicotinate-nucleotide--dimethylbenzimidazole phosphoribosyltransferase
MMDWLTDPIAKPDPDYFKRAQHHQNQLTKPPGSLGQLETIALRLAALQRKANPQLTSTWVSVFAADHGIATQGVSAFPQSVTASMVKNFASGGAAVNVLARYLDAQLEVIDVGLVTDETISGVIGARAGKGTADFSLQPAMTRGQLVTALTAGKQAAQRAKSNNTHLFIGAEMGIANTTSASAIACALLNQPAAKLTGAGTGLDSDKINRKAQLIQVALHYHQTKLDSPLRILEYLGGFEIAALVGAYLHAAQINIPILVDGFICTCAALIAVKINPALQNWLFFAHCSHEQGHKRVLQALQANPLLNLDMRLGEGSGALAAVPLMQMACRLHNEMASFSQANVATAQ